MRAWRTWWQRGRVRALAAVLCASATLAAAASEHHGVVLFNGLPVPGVTVTATHDGKTVTAVSDADGRYSFPDLSDGPWTLKVTMTGFAAATQDVQITADAKADAWDLQMLPVDAMLAQTKVVVPNAPAVTAATVVAPAAKKNDTKAAESTEPPKPADDAVSSSDGFLVNGSVNNAATSQFSLAQAFGNTRKGSKSLYTGGLGLIVDNSALDARAYSLNGSSTAKPAYNTVTAVATFGGPIRIPHLLPRGPNFFVAYQWTRERNAATETGLVPTVAQRSGVLATGTIPTAQIDPVATALLALYPLPNAVGAAYNYQTTVVNAEHQDSMQMRLDKTIGRRDSFNGGIAFQNTRGDTTNLFAFRDTSAVLGLTGNVNWNRRLNHGLYTTLGYKFSRQRTSLTPFFEGRRNVSGDAGIVAATGPQRAGSLQDPADYGPPTLNFGSGIASLSDGNSAFNRNRTEAVSGSVQYYRGRHNVTLGGDFRRQEFNRFEQTNPRGSYSFTGAATGVSDLADFLRGKPDTSAVAFGNPDKYLRQSVYDAYLTDDWRLRPELTLNIGVRWEYGAPMTELKGRLVNLDVAADFSRVAPVLASAPVGPVTGQTFPSSLVRPDRHLYEPRIGLSWRPIPGSSLVIRSGYGIYADSSIYLRNALRMAVQPPLARNMSVAATACPLTLAGGFAQTQCDADTFGVDPNFQVGYAQTWQVAAQRDLPFALQMTATYLGVKGSHGVQQFLPNSYALGAANPCPSCPSGFYYRTTEGTSSRNAGSLQLRRRLRSGFTATALYTYSKSIDDDAALGGQGASAGGTSTQSSGGSQPAQNWRDLHAERSLSTFDQRHLLTASLQYTSGQGIGGGTLLGGWRGRLLKEWTAATQINVGSGLPENPIYYATVPGTGETGILRPDRTSASLYGAAPGRFVNAAAFAAPAPGQFGNAGRNSIEGPGTFTCNASLARTFRVKKDYSLDVRVDATNVLNHVVYAGYNTVLSPAAAGPNLVFGLPTGANPMRSLQTTARLRF